MARPLFSAGDVVRLRADPTRVGSVVGIHPSSAGETRYKVFHGPGDLREYDEDQLVADSSVSSEDVLFRTLTGMPPVNAEAFRARLTAARLAHALIDNLYALRAARVRFVPFQFKPLLRLLRADQPRLLIADDVGVGKTIEAGLILRELQARHEIDNVLVVCPKDLCPKWRAEMRRFDENFRILTSEGLRYCLSQTHYDGVWPREWDRAIAPLQLLRRRDYLVGEEGQRWPGLRGLDPPPRFTLLIIDEAHHLRNPGTNNYELAEVLCSVSEVVVFLSATPVQTGSQNLFSLLNLLRPDVFPDLQTFNRSVEPNRFISRAMRHVRTLKPAGEWQGHAAAHLEAAAATPWGRSTLAQNVAFAVWRTRLADAAPVTDEERIRCLRDLEEGHSLAHVMNRTRRRDIGAFTQREPKTVAVPFTPEQEEFYRALVDFRYRLLLTRYDTVVARLILDMLERQAASCLTAVVPTLDTFIRTGKFTSAEITDIEEEGDLPDELNIPSELLIEARALRERAHALPASDPKLEQFLHIVRETLASSEGAGKLLVFSFFLRTIAYLADELLKAGFRVGVVTGRVDEVEREHLRDRFRRPRAERDAIDVLISSEVGCEGLDYEFCDRLVNYDIPWNPMRIEQRIGRIDRFGQRSPKILIFNFVTPGTVEERIYFRCFDRLGVFRDTVGDLEEVLGEFVEILHKLVFDPSLTPAQVDERTRQAADNALRLAAEQRRLEEEAAGLLGLDVEFEDEVKEIAATGRFVAPDELRQMIDAFLAAEGLGRRVSDNADTRLDMFVLSRRGRQELHDLVVRLDARARTTIEFVRLLERESGPITVTFDQDAALEHREVPFITPVHALAQAAAAWWNERQEPLVAHLSIRDRGITPGRYLFAVELWEQIGAREAQRLAAAAVDLQTEVCLPHPEDALLRLLRRAADAPAVVTAKVPAATREALDLELLRLRRGAAQALKAANAALVDQRLASTDGYYKARLDRLTAEVLVASDSRINRMKTAERDRVEREYQERRQEIEVCRDADVIARRLALGILEVLHGN
ncbi:MAG: DEAD/DEAH box helicase [Candidatus Rokubacteria bacterium]|nr:DEAD/DEAH box helicase [Candidatus Rokubacteria bacterium]